MRPGQGWSAGKDNKRRSVGSRAQVVDGVVAESAIVDQALRSPIYGCSPIRIFSGGPSSDPFTTKSLHIVCPRGIVTSVSSKERLLLSIGPVFWQLMWQKGRRSVATGVSARDWPNMRRRRQPADEIFFKERAATTSIPASMRLARDQNDLPNKHGISRTGQ